MLGRFLLFWRGREGGMFLRVAALGGSARCLSACTGCGWDARNRHKHMTTSETWVLHPLRVACAGYEPDALMLTSS